MRELYEVIGASSVDSPVAGNRPAGWRGSNWLAAVEFVIVALIFFADYHHWIFFSKTPYLLALGWISLRLRKVSWRSVGFTRNAGWRRTLGWGLAGGVALEMFQLLVTQPLLVRLTGKAPDVSELAGLRGNVKYALLGVALSWTLAAFGEELVWRGYLLNRAADVFGWTAAGWVCSVLFVNAVFGLAHSYQGLTGILEEGIAGLFLAGMYMRTGKNLAVPIVAHGVTDTIDMVLLFLGKYPGT